MAHRGVFYFDRADPLSSRLDYIFAAIGYLHVTVGIDGRDVASEKPAVLEVVVPIALEVRGSDPWAADLKMPRRPAVVRQHVSAIVHQTEVDAKDGPALLHLDRELIFSGQTTVLRQHDVGRAKRTRFG